MTQQELWRKLGVEGTGARSNGTGARSTGGPSVRWPHLFMSAGPCEVCELPYCDEPSRYWNGLPWFSETTSRLRRSGHNLPRLKIPFPVVPDNDLLHEERKKLASRLHEPAPDCQLCGRRNKLYDRTVVGAQIVGVLLMAQWFQQVWRGAPDLERFGRRDAAGAWWVKFSAYFNTLGDVVPYSAKGGGAVAKMRFLRLIENLEARRADGSTRNGHWRLTDVGWAFAQKRMPLPGRYVEWNNRLYGVAGELRPASHFLTEKFDLDRDMKPSGLRGGVP